MVHGKHYRVRACSLEHGMWGPSVSLFQFAFVRVTNDCTYYTRLKHGLDGLGNQAEINIKCIFF